MAYILIVDEDPRILGLMTEILTGEGHHVVSVPNVFKALEALDYKTPHLVLTELILTDLDGWALTRAIRQYHPQVPVIAVTNQTKDCHNTFDAVVNKPFSIKELTDTVATILNRSSSAEKPSKGGI